MSYFDKEQEMWEQFRGDNTFNPSIAQAPSDADRVKDDNDPLVKSVSVNTTADGTTEEITTKNSNYTKQQEETNQNIEDQVVKSESAFNAAVNGSPFTAPITDKVVVANNGPSVMPTTVADNSQPFNPPVAPMPVEQPEILKTNSSAQEALAEFNKRITNKSPEQRQQEYKQFLIGTDQLKSWKPELFKAMVGTAMGMIGGDTMAQSAEASLGGAEKTRVEEEEKNEKYVMQIIKDNPGISNASFQATLAQMGVTGQQAKRLSILFGGAHNTYAGLAQIEADKVTLVARNKAEAHASQVIKSALGDKAFMLEPQMSAVLTAIDGIPGADFSDKGIKTAYLRAIKQSVLDFNNNDGNEQEVATRLLGHFWEQISLVSSDGIIAGDDIKDTTAEQHATLARWMYGLPKGDRVRKLDQLKKNWTKHRDDSPSNWYGKNNFTEWAITHLANMDAASSFK